MDTSQTHISVLLQEAVAAGVELLAYGADISPQQMVLTRRLPIVC